MQQCMSKHQHHIQSRSQSFVPLDQRSENESSGSIHFEITMGNNRILVIRFTAQSQSASISCYGACLKWLLPELSFSDRWSRGTKLWERDCITSHWPITMKLCYLSTLKLEAVVFKFLRFSCVSPVIDYESRHNIVKVAVDRNSLPITGQTNI